MLEDKLENVKGIIQRLLPMEKKLNALEEAEFEDEGGEEGALEREMLSQGNSLIFSRELCVDLIFCSQPCRL